MAELASLTVALQDSFSAGASAVEQAANKMAAAFDKAAASSATTDTAIRTRGQSFDSITAKIDGNAAATSRLEAIERKYQAAVQITTASMTAQGASAADIANSIVRLGNVRDADAAKAVTYGQKIEAVATGANSLATATDKVGASSSAASGHMNGFSLASAGATRELIVLGHEAISGNWNRIPGSLIVMAERAGGLHDIISGLTNFVTSMGGAFTIAGVAGVAALAAMGVEAQHESTRMDTLRQQLRATHDDYVSLATSVDDAAKKVAATTTASIADARTAAQTIASAAYFKGTQADIQALATTSLNLARVWHEDVGAAAKFIAGALDDPGKAAQELAQKHFPGMTAALAQSVVQLQAAGQSGAAFNIVLGTLQKGTSGATDGTSPLSKAIKSLDQTFHGAADGGKSLATSLGDFVDVQAARVVVGLNDVINAVVRASTAVGNAVSAAKAAQSGYHSMEEPTLPASSFSSAPAVSTTQQVLQGPAIAGKTERGAGIFQVLPSTGSEMGYDVNDPTQNIQAGLSYLQKLYTDSGSLDLALSKYGGYGTNVTKAQDYISKVYSADSSNLPTSVSGKSLAEQIDYWGNVFGMSPGMIEIGKKLALVESGGRQYTSTTTDLSTTSSSPIRTAATGTSIGVGFDTTSGAAVSSSTVDSAKAYNDQLQNQLNLTREIENEGYDKQIAALTARMKEEKDAGFDNTAQYREEQQVLDGLTAKRRANVDALTAAQRASDSSLASTRGTTAADQALSAALEARNQLLLQSRGIGLSAAEADQVRTNVLAAQNQEFGRVTASIAIATASSVDLTDAYNKGNQAVINVTAEQAAYNEALKLYGLNIPADKLNALVNSYKLQAEWAGRAQVAQTNLNSRDNLAYIQTETSTLGENEAQRNRTLTVMQAEQEMHRKFGDVLPQEALDYINLKGAISDATSAYQHQQSVTSELGSFFTNTFDTISNSITSAFANGTLSALKFKDIAMSVASAVLSEFVKLAVVNPLKSLLFGSTNSTVTLGDVLGFLGGGTTSTIGASSSGNSASGIVNLVFSDGSKVATTTTGAASSSGGVGVLQAGSALATGASTANSAGLFGDLFKDGSVTGLNSLGSWIVEHTIATLGGQAAVSAATNAALAANLGAGEVGVATTSQVAGAAIGQAVGATSNESIAALGSAVGQVADALPYIGVAISLISDIASGNYRGAGFVAGGALTGAAIGSVVPVIGTAVGAAVGAVVGGLADAFFPAHPLHSYQGTEVMTEGGHVVAGKTVDQVQSSDDAVASINDFGKSLDTYMQKVGIVLTNLDGTLGDVGQGISGLTQYASVTDPAILSKLQFAPNPSDTSNFGVAKGALTDMSFSTIGDLNTELIKIAGFADAASAVGIQLSHVAKDLTNIQISGVTGGNANALGSVTDASGNVIQYHNDLRTALNADLPGQTFADTTALDTEISKVNTFVNTTVPQLLTPIEQTSSSITTAVDNIAKTYADAINQSEQYGLDNTQVLLTAEQQAIAIIRRTALLSLTQSQTSIVDRFAIALDDSPTTQQTKTLDDLLASQTNEIETYTKSWTDIFGDGIKSSAVFQAALGTLVSTLGAEYTAKVNATNKAIKASQDSLYQTAEGYYARDAAASGNQEGSDLLTADIKAAQERQSFIDSFDSTYGQLAESSQYFQDTLVEIDKVHAAERLAIEKKYATDSTGVTATALQNALSQAQGNVVSLFGNLQSYAHSLQTGSDSPLSPTAQYALASRQFNAVSSAAAAGDYTSASQLQTYAQSLVSASRTVYGSGTQYAADVARVVDAISGTAANANALTLSAQQKIVQDQTTAIVDSQTQVLNAVNDLKAEIIAVRREMQQQARAA